MSEVPQSAGHSNPEQEAIIRHIRGAILVLAPVGTGKTWTLTERIAAALAGGCQPAGILCLTFTNRACREIRERIGARMPQDAKLLTVMTFHGLCAHILRNEAREVGLPDDFLVFDEEDCAEIIKEVTPGADDRMTKDYIWRILQYKTDAVGNGCTDLTPEILYAGLPEPLRSIASRYQRTLTERHALDFADLVCHTRLLLKTNKAAADRWAHRYDFVQVDEVQDTHLSEYEIVQHLAQAHGNLAMIGDMDQTIYEWRGSTPGAIIERFRDAFSPAEYELVQNYRATKALLTAASRFAETFSKRYTHCTPHDSCPAGLGIVSHRAQNEDDEAAWVAASITRIAGKTPDFAYSRVGILTRTNNRSIVIARGLESAGVPCVTVEQYEFFRRQEIKDALALLRLLLNPHDAGSMRRVLLRPPRGIGPATLADIANRDQMGGLKPTDFLLQDTHGLGDPFGPLIDAWHQGDAVVLDVESTGISTTTDEVIEVAAIRIRDGETIESLHVYIRNDKPVGDSFAIHGLSDEFLAKNGIEAREAFRQLAAFCDGRLVIGHNIRFDLKITRNHAARVGATLFYPRVCDTWELARRTLPTARNYRLETIADELGVKVVPNHRADQDVAATAAVLGELISRWSVQTEQRAQSIRRHGDAFRPIARLLEGWRGEADNHRPAALLKRVLEESGLLAFYRQRNEHRRLVHLDHLIAVFEKRDNPALPPRAALEHLVEFTSLARGVDYLSTSDNLVPIITIHQAKGLEFDHVFIPGLVEGELPSYYATRDGKLEEEKRLFYVAMTRAKSGLYISGHEKNAKGFQTKESSFLASLRPQRL